MSKSEIYRRRPTWEESFMATVDVTAQRSVCLFYQVGVVFVEKSNKNVLVSGYNGPASGEPHCCDVGCAKLSENGEMLPPGSGKCRGCHAEMNAVHFAATEGIAIKNTIIYCTFSPCRECAKHLIRLNPVRFVYQTKYESDFKEVEKMFERHNIELIQFKGEKGGT